MAEMPSVASFISRSAQECGFDRERFVESKLPSDFDKIVVFLFLGDLRSLSILSTLLFRTYCDNILKDKYIIFCGLPGMGSIFPRADEYWSISDALSIGDLMIDADGFTNKNKRYNSILVQLHRRFNTVITGDDFALYYNNGLTSSYFDRFKKINRFFPQLPNWRSGDVGMNIVRSGKHGVFLYPNFEGRCWDRGKEVSLKFPKDFWIKLTESLLSNGFFPIVYQNQITYDISPNFGERCMYCTDRNFSSILGAMRASGCVLDIFSGISRMALLARTPFLVIDERQRYINSKEFEINDLCIDQLYPYKYVFSFPTLIGSGSYNELIKQTINVINKFILQVKDITLPPLKELYEEISYDIVRQHKAKKLGIHFIKVERLVVE